jgi:uncharacterized membrane protein YhaH (DUF805 family)/DnaJ-domain-containing protein 1
MKKYYQILGLDEGATLQEVEKKYNELLKEFDPQKQSDDDLKEFFKSEQDKVKEAYLKISLSFTNINEEVVITKEIDNLDVDDSNDILIYYKTLKLSEDATLAEINTKYNLLLDEFNPDHQSDDLRDFFETEQEKVKEAYNTIIKHLSEEEASEEQVEKYLNEGVVDSEVHDLGDYLGNDETKFCKFCGHMQYVTNSECINCLESFHNSFSKSSGSKNIVETGEVKRMFSAPFSFKGRIRRLEYFLSLLIFGVSLYLLFLISDEFRLYDDWYSLFLIPSFWFIASQGAKRFHDCWMSGWLQLIPYINILLIIFVIFKDGKIGDNKYGSNPKGLNYN